MSTTEFKKNFSLKKAVTFIGNSYRSIACGPHALRALVVLLFVVTFAVSAAAQSSQPTVYPRIINGSPSDEGKWPWMASLSEAGSDPADTHFCGGALISPSYVLTAAHCVLDYVSHPFDLQVVVGRTRLTSNRGHLVGVDGVIVYPTFNENTIESDAALVHLSEPILDQTPISTISAGDQQFWQAGSSATIIGWGAMDPDFPIRPDNLQEAQLPIIASEECSKRLGLDFTPDSMICAGKLASTAESDDSIDACYGDSGGPLMVQTPSGYKIAGIVSWGISCGSPKYWGVYTRVAAFIDWINSFPGIAPFNSTQPVVDGIPQVGSKLTCDRGEWGGDTPVGFAYQWVDDEGITLGKGISYKLRPTDLGKKIGCTVKATNGSGVFEASSELAGPIFPKSASLPLRSKRSALQRAIMVCKPSKCELLVSLKNSETKTVEALIVPQAQHCSSNGTRAGTCAAVESSNWQEGKAVTRRAWTFKLRRRPGAAYNLFFRAISKDGTQSSNFNFRISMPR